MIRFKKISTFIIKIIIVYVLYLYVGGVLVFAMDRPKESNYQETHEVSRFYGETMGSDRVVLLDDRYEALIARLDFIQEANETIDIAYFQYVDDATGKLFFSNLIEAADRGVKIRLLADGLPGNLNNVDHALFALNKHQNIEVKVFEPFNYLKPWTFQNRMHDKMMIVDGIKAMIGGRNIQYRFYAPEDYDSMITNDLDVMILNPLKDSNSVLRDMDTYYSELWSNDYTKEIKKGFKRDRSSDYRKELEEYITQQRLLNPELFNIAFDWFEESIVTNKVTLIHNPIDRLNKEPWIWMDLSALFKSAEESIWIQSPYIVPTKKMNRLLDDVSIAPSKITLLTNSIASNPNTFGAIGYMRYRETFIDHGVSIYEYQGPETIHGKSLVIDERLTIIGSFNMDARSSYLSTESMVVIDSESFAEQFKSMVNEQYLPKSLFVQKDYTYGPEPVVDPTTMTTWKKIYYETFGIIVDLHDYMI